MYAEGKNTMALITCTYSLCMKLLYIHSFDAKRISVPASNLLIGQISLLNSLIAKSTTLGQLINGEKVTVDLGQIRLDKIRETSGVGGGEII